MFHRFSTWNAPYTSYVDRALAPVAPVKPYLAAVGAAFLTVKAVRALLTLGRGVVSYGLAAPLGLGGDLRKIGDWAVITGASDGCGKEYAHQLAAKGMNVVLLARNQDKTEQVAQEIRNIYKVLAKVIILDLSQINAGDVRSIQDQLRGLKIALVINNAGLYPSEERFLACPVEDEKVVDLINVNVLALVLVTRAVLPLLVSQGKGYIMNTSSCLAEKPVLGEALYSATKTFVDYFSQALDYEYKHTGIRVVSLVAGMIRTSLIGPELHKNPFAVDTKDFVRSTLGLVGFRQRHHGHWRHALMSHLGSCMPNINLLNIKK